VGNLYSDESRIFSISPTKIGTNVAYFNND